jgi:hypothetical protein
MVPSFSFHSQVSGGGSLLNASLKKKSKEGGGGVLCARFPLAIHQTGKWSLI